MNHEIRPNRNWVMLTKASLFHFTVNKRYLTEASKRLKLKQNNNQKSTCFDSEGKRKEIYWSKKKDDIETSWLNHFDFDHNYGVLNV